MRPQWIPRNKSCASPGNLLFFDTETLPEPTPNGAEGEAHRLRLGVAIASRYEQGRITRRQVCRFSSQEAFWAFVRQRAHRRIPLWVFAHNLVFDFTVVGGWLELDRSNLILSDRQLTDSQKAKHPKRQTPWDGLIVASDPPTVFQLRLLDGGTIYFVDTLNYWRSSLDKLGESVGLSKLPMPPFDAYDDEWFPYCERDVEILEEAVCGLIGWTRDNDMGKFRFTAPSLAMGAYRHKYMGSGIELHDLRPVKRLERACYYGGRLEMFRRGRVRQMTYELDVASMYPYVMREGAYPCQLLASDWHRGIRPPTPETLDHTYAAEVLLHTRDSAYPLRCREGTVYPVGDYWTYLCGDELARAVREGVVREIGKWSRYKCRPLFREWVDDLWGLRLEYEQSGQELQATFVKLLLNSLYGKFGQKSIEWLESIKPDEFPRWGHQRIINVRESKVDYYRVLADRCQLKVEADEHPLAFPAIAAWITAAAREHLLTLMRIAGPRNVYYCVTDALYCNQRGLDNLTAAGWVAGRELGKLGVKTVGKSAEFVALHHLRVGDKRLHGSRKKSAVELSPGIVQETHFEGFASVTAGEPKDWVRVYPMVKQFRREYNRGTVGRNGWIHPLVFTGDGK